MPPRGHSEWIGRRAAPLIVAAACAFGHAAAALAQPYFEFRFQSEAGDYIGGGSSYVRTNATGVIDTYNLLDLTADGAVDYLFLRYLGEPFDGTFIHFWVATNQLGQNLVPGIYPNAERAPFASAGHPGLDVEMDGRGCNTLTGNFVIHEVNFGPGPELERLDMEFEQHCEGAMPALRGSLRYNRTSPLSLATPVPAMGPGSLMALASLLFATACAAVARRQDRRSRNGAPYRKGKT